MLRTSEAEIPEKIRTSSLSKKLGVLIKKKGVSHCFKNKSIGVIIIFIQYPSNLLPPGDIRNVSHWSPSILSPQLLILFLCQVLSLGSGEVQRASLSKGQLHFRVFRGSLHSHYSQHELRGLGRVQMQQRPKLQRHRHWAARMHPQSIHG